MYRIMTDQKPNWFESFTSFMDQNIRGIQYGVYTIALTGLAVSLRSVRPFKKFSKPHEIPTSFVEKHLTLQGKAMGVEPPYGNNPAYLLIDHSPIISLAWVRPRKPNLPVQISGVNVTPNGLSWLQHVVIGSPVKFTVLKVNPDAACCIVTVEKKNVGLDLVSLGFASVSPLDFHLEKDRLYLKYYKQLLAAEDLAEKKGCGIWANDKNNTPKSQFTKISKGVGSILSLLLNNLKKVLRRQVIAKPNTTIAVVTKT